MPQKKGAEPEANQVRIAVTHPTLGILAASVAKFTRAEASRLIKEARVTPIAVTIPDEMPRPSRASKQK